MQTRSHPSPARRRLALAAAATIGALGATALVAPPAYAAPVEVQILATNDFHGRILDNTTNGEAGAAVLAGAVKQLRDENPNTVFAAAGDLIGASTFESFIAHDKPTIDALNEAGLEVSAVGNHELDQGYSDLVDRVMAPFDPVTNPYGGAEWQYIAANLELNETGDPAVPATWTQEFGGVTVGFVGAVTEELPSLVSPAGIAEIQVNDIVESVNAEAASLVASGADVVVMLVHEGAPSTDCAAMPSTPGAWADIVNGVSADVDAIVSGHTHLAYDCSFPVQSWVDEGRAVTERPVVSAGQYGTNLNRLTFTVDDETGEVLAKSQTIIALEDDTNAPLFPADETVSDIVTAAAADAEVLGAVPLGEITADFNRAKLASGAENRGGESTLGNFVADAQLWAAQRTDPSAQIAFMNPGGLRTDMVFAPDGVLTYREAALVQPFANTLVATTLTGAQIQEALEQQWQPAGATRPFLKLGTSAGFEYAFDPAAAPGARITSMTFDGAPIDPAASYRVVVNSFLAAGGDNFGAFAEGSGVADTGQADLASMVDYMAFVGSASPDYAQRSIGVSLSAASANGYAPGSTIDVALSSLDFSTTEPKAGTVAVSIGGVPVGTAPVDSTVGADPLDVTGTATLSVTVPAGVSGTVPLTVTTPTGTEISVPVTVFEKAKSATIGWPSKLLAKHGSSVSYTTVVLAKDAVPTGTVTVYDGSKPIATATLTTASRGTVTVKLPSLSRGIHLIWASYSGDDGLKGSNAPKLPVIIW